MRTTEHPARAIDQVDPAFEVELSAGMIEYEGTGGRDPVGVLLRGLVMDSSQSG
jgi:hypothetical protein